MENLYHLICSWW